MNKKFVTHPLFHEPTEIKAALNGVASQEQNDGPDYDLMVEAATYIEQLEKINESLSKQVNVDCCCDKNISILFAKLDREKRESEIRLYGVLWYLVEHEIISQGKAMELARKPLGDIIGECIEWRKNS